ncbi:hypothetical protein ES703_71550 [subsurface metagenome]
MVNKQRAVGRLGAGADIPPELFAVLTPLFGRLMFVVTGDRAPDVRPANQVRLDLFC